MIQPISRPGPREAPVTDGAKTTPTVSVVLPFSNNESEVLNVVEEVHHAITSRIPGSEIVAVDAQSRDHTWSMLRELPSAYPELKIYRLMEPAGYGAASARGFLEAVGKFVFHREPHCPWKMEVFWQLAQRRADAGAGAVFAARPPARRGLKEKAMDRLFRDEALDGWTVEIPDTGAPLQFFAKNDFERVHVLLPQDMLAPGLTLFLLFVSFQRQVVSITPPDSFLRGGVRQPAPPFFSGIPEFRQLGSQIAALRRNLQRIQGLMQIR
jgi:hypothetical protein